jgi:hypothetical protein
VADKKISDLTSSSTVSSSDLFEIENGSGNSRRVAASDIKTYMGVGFGFRPPAAADFTLFSGDGSSATLTDDTDVGLVVTTASATASAIIRGGYKTLPAVGTDFNVVMRAQLSCPTNNNSAGGLVIYESATGKSHGYLLFEATGNHQIRRQTIGGTYNSDVKVVPAPSNFDCWLKIARSGTTLIFSRSADGKNWATIQSISQTTYLTTAPDRIGPAVWLGHATDIPVLTVPYWSQSF